MADVLVTPVEFQKKFLFSTKRFPALISGIGTGKTYMLLLKIWLYCQEYPQALAMIVRKEYTDMRDSTIKDFTRYFGVGVDSNKEFKFANGSQIMFRHGDELNVLKNITLDIVGIEQAEEFPTDETFTFLRDRLRGKAGQYQQLCVIANASGHNWLWKKWINNPASAEYDCTQASTFDNEINLPKSFVSDLRTMEREAPNHYRQYVLNSNEDIESDDNLLNYEAVYRSPNIEISNPRSMARIISCDVARYGQDSIVWCVVEQKNITQWEVIHVEEWKDKNRDNITMQVVGKTADLMRSFGPDMVVVDDDGIGGGVVDRLGELGHKIERFTANAQDHNLFYDNRKDVAWFNLLDMFNRDYIKIIDDDGLKEELMSIRYKYKSNGKKSIVSKDDMRKAGFKSPNKADALMMALWGSTFINTHVESFQSRAGYPRYAICD